MTTLALPSHGTTALLDGIAGLAFVAVAVVGIVVVRRRHIKGWLPALVVLAAFGLVVSVLAFSGTAFCGPGDEKGCAHVP